MPLGPERIEPPRLTSSPERRRLEDADWAPATHSLLGEAVAEADELVVLGAGRRSDQRRDADADGDASARPAEAPYATPLRHGDPPRQTVAPGPRTQRSEAAQPRPLSPAIAAFGPGVIGPP